MKNVGRQAGTELGQAQLPTGTWLLSKPNVTQLKATLMQLALELWECRLASKYENKRGLTSILKSDKLAHEKLGREGFPWNRRP